jgi:hypothetical protein
MTETIGSTARLENVLENPLVARIRMKLRVVGGKDKSRVPFAAPWGFLAAECGVEER